MTEPLSPETLTELQETLDRAATLLQRLCHINAVLKEELASHAGGRANRAGGATADSPPPTHPEDQ